MADIERLIRSLVWFAFGLFLGGSWTMAYAETIPATSNPPQTVTEAGTTTYYGYSQSKVPTWSGYCSAQRAASSQTLGSCSDGAAPVGHGTSSTCGYMLSGSCRTFAGYAEVACSPGYVMINKACVNNVVVYTCPTGKNWTLSGNQCTRPDCVAPQTLDPSTGVCSAPSCPAAGTTTTGVTGSFYTGSGSMPATLCISGCVYSTQGLGVGTSTGWGLEAGKSTGASCTNAPASTVPPEDPKAKCISSGQGFGTVNGQVVCVPPTMTTAPKTTTKTAPGGNSTTNQTTTTICTGAGSCTTTTTTTTTSGGSGPGGTGPGSTTSEPTTTETDLPKSVFCEENPNAAMCKNSSFAGTCGSLPACDGDAVQCAQAKATFELNCTMKTEPTDDAYKLGKLVSGGGADPAGNPLAADKVETVNVSSIIQDAASVRTLSAQCIPAPSFTVAGNSFTFNVTPFCNFAQIVGYLMVAASTVIAIRMVSGG